MNENDVIQTLSGQRRPLDWLNIQQDEQLDFDFLESLRKLGSSFMSLFTSSGPMKKTIEEEHKKVEKEKTEKPKPKIDVVPK